MAEARLELEGSTAKLIVRYTDDSTSILSAAIQRSNAAPQTFTLGFDSLPKKKFEFSTIPQLKTGILKCAECLEMSAISSLKP
ncbi:hypothetical protein LL972_11260 [Xanthomonas campestris pv. asclepiadis]|nr:hypothetical protein [Xanthomonas campestris pv. asclepiadis]